MPSATETTAAPPAGPTGAPPLLQVVDLKKAFVTPRLFGRPDSFLAVQQVSFRVERGEAVALVGESGSGKSTIARLLVRLSEPDGGQIRLDGTDVLEREPRRASLGFRGRVQMVFQDPFGSLNPVHSVAHHIERPLLRHGRIGPLNPAIPVEGQVSRPMVRHGRVTKEELRERTLQLLRDVGLEPAEEYLHRHPYELSGGQRQRVAIARALAVEPDLLIADEPTSMLDVSIRTGVLNLLAKLKKERRLGIVLITHDLASARYLADRVMVLYRGRIVEEGPIGEVVAAPKHPYTKALLGAVADASESGLTATPPRTLAERAIPKVGCPFAPRCADVMDRCHAEDPGPRAAAPGRNVRCHLFPLNTTPKAS